MIKIGVKIKVNPALVRVFLLPAILCFCFLYSKKAEAADAGNDIRVGLKSSYALKGSITLYNTSLEVGYCDGSTYEPEIFLRSEQEVCITPEKGDYFAVRDYRSTSKEAEKLAQRLREAGAAAYAVLFSAENAGVYLPVGENGGTKEAAKVSCMQAAERCGVSLEEAATSSSYLIKISASERVLFADGAEGCYPQFGAGNPDEKGRFVVNLGTKSYRGRIEVGRYGGKNTVTAVNVVNLEEYLYGVVPCEMPASWPLEALKAQAVCARSYAMIKAGFRGQTEIKRGYRIEDTVQSQVYGGVTFEHERSNIAVEATKGETLCYGNRTVAGYYFAASGGHTENSEDVWGFSLPYLKGVPDIYETSPSKYPWSVVLTKAELAELLSACGENIGEILKLTREITTESGRVYSLKVTGSLTSVSLSTSAIRNVLKLSGTKFKVVEYGSTPDKVTVKGAGSSVQASLHDCYVLDGSGRVRKAEGLTDQYVVLSRDNLTNFPRKVPEKDSFLFAGMGYGHGVGMSQSGAKGMAAHGFLYHEILTHYFTGITVR